MGNGRKVMAGAFVALLLMSGCSKVAEKAAEKATGCKNIDLNNGNGANAECNGQKLGIDVNGNAKLPDGFPAELAPPKGTKIYSAISDKSATGLTTFSITASLQGDPKAVANGLLRQLKDAGYTISNNSISSGTDGVGGNITAQGKKYGVVAIFGQNTTNAKDGGTFITMNVRELSPEEANQTTVPDTTEQPGDTTETTAGSDNSSTSGQSLPANWPSELDPPAGTKILSATANNFGGKNSWYVLAAVPGSVDDIVAGLKSQLTSAGFTIAYSGTTEANGVKLGTVSGASATLTAAIGVGNSVASGQTIPSGSTAVAFTLAEK